MTYIRSDFYHQTVATTIPAPTIIPKRYQAEPITQPSKKVQISAQKGKPIPVTLKRCNKFFYCHQALSPDRKALSQ